MQKRSPSSGESEVRVSSEEKIARLLALLVIKDLEQKGDQVTLLLRVGFSLSEVAAVLDMTTHNVSDAKYKKSKGKGGKRR